MEKFTSFDLKIIFSLNGKKLTNHIRRNKNKWERNLITVYLDIILKKILLAEFLFLEA